MLRADLHIHSCYSPDCGSTPQAIVQLCLRRGINCIAITDHNAIEGALRTQEIAPFPVIVGEEIRTPQGEIMGLFLQKRVPPGLPLREAIEQVRGQGGIVGVPHPLDGLARSSLRREALESVLPHIHFVEGFNARSLFSQNSVAQWGREHGLGISAGSDAHTPGEIGNAYVEMPPFTTPQEFLLSLKQGQIWGRRTPPWVRGLSLSTRLWRLLRRPP